MTKKKIGLTSLQAAALFLSDGQTTDMATASQIDKGKEIDIDALQKAHLRRMMGFDFRIKLKPNKIHISSKQEPFVTTHCKVNQDEMDDKGNIYSEALIDRLVDACMRLKIKHDIEVVNNK